MKENAWPEQRMCGHSHNLLLSRKGKIRSPSGQAIPCWSLAAALNCTLVQTDTRSLGQKQANFMSGYSSIPPHVTGVSLSQHFARFHPSLPCLLRGLWFAGNAGSEAGYS